MKQFIVGLAFLFAAAYASTQVENWPVLLSRINTWTAQQKFTSIAGAQAATITVGSNAGAGATAVCDTADGFECTSVAGVVVLTISSATASSALFTVSWGTPLPYKAICFFQGANQAVANQVYILGGASSTTSIAYSNYSAPGAGTYKIGYGCFS